MNIMRLDQCLRKKVTLLSALAPVAVCTFALVFNSAAQTAAPTPAPAQAVATANGSALKFKAPSIPTLKAGVPTAFNLCNGKAVSLPAGKFSDADGLKLDTAQTPCGEQTTTTPNTVAGGNAPYHFQMDSGSFPPLGMHLGMNGLLYGTPAPPTLGGYKPFKVCAVDLSGNADCHEVTIQSQSATQAKGHSVAVPLALVGGAAVLGGAFAVHQMNNSSTSSGSGVSAGQCDGFGSTVNACGPCQCDPNGSGSTACPSNPQCGGGQCFNYSSDGNQKAPFC